MTTLTARNEEVLVRSIMSTLPQSPVIIKEVDNAINVLKANAVTEKQVLDKLETAYEIAKYVAKTADSPLFIQYHLVIIALLDEITDMSKLAEFETASNLVINGIKALQDVDTSKGVVARNTLHQAKLINSNQDLYLIRVLEMTQQVNEILNSEKQSTEMYATLLELAMIEQSVRINHFTINDTIFPYVNNFMTALGKANL